MIYYAKYPYSLVIYYAKYPYYLLLYNIQTVHICSTLYAKYPYYLVIYHSKHPYMYSFTLASLRSQQAAARYTSRAKQATLGVNPSPQRGLPAKPQHQN